MSQFTFASFENVLSIYLQRNTLCMVILYKFLSIRKDIHLSQTQNISNSQKEITFKITEPAYESFAERKFRGRRCVSMHVTVGLSHRPHRNINMNSQDGEFGSMSVRPLQEMGAARNTSVYNPLCLF